MKAKFVREAVEFERGKDPYDALRIGKGRFGLKPYPKASIEEFHDWHDEWIEPYYQTEEEFEMMMDSISNDELSSDEELLDHWKSIGADMELAQRLIVARDYFLNFEYIKNLG